MAICLSCSVTTATLIWIKGSARDWVPPNQRRSAWSLRFESHCSKEVSPGEVAVVPSHPQPTISDLDHTMGQPSCGIALLGMRERLRMLGGSFEVKPAPDAGAAPFELFGRVFLP
jgi:hypothetical protein